MTMTTYDKVSRALYLATGDEWGDSSGCVDRVIIGFADEEYGDRDAVVVAGNWNQTRWQRDGEPPLTAAETFPSRLGDVLEHLGAEVVWLDELTECSGCYRAIRTEADSYSWRPRYAWIEDYGIFCRDCLNEDVEGALVDGGYINDANKCVTWTDTETLSGLGFEHWEPGNPHLYQSSWFEGMDADPHKVLDQIQERFENAEVVFYLDTASQFYCDWSAYVRIPASDDEEEE